ncbi:MAG: hypothetical protein AAGF55_10245 [Pseudomonadota bacterium]
MTLRKRITSLEKARGSNFTVVLPRPLDANGQRFDDVPQDDKIQGASYSLPGGGTRVFHREGDELLCDFEARVIQAAKDELQPTVVLDFGCKDL